MSAAPSNSSALPADSYLHQVEELRAELQGAMTFLSGNHLSAFEDSLWRQKTLCISLKHLSTCLASEALEASLSRRIQDSTAALQDVSRTYAALLQQAGESNALLLRLVRSYAEAHPTAAPFSGSAPGRLLSCEA